MILKTTTLSFGAERRLRVEGVCLDGWEGPEVVMVRGASLSSVQGGSRLVKVDQSQSRLIKADQPAVGCRLDEAGAGVLRYPGKGLGTGGGDGLSLEGVRAGKGGSRLIKVNQSKSNLFSRSLGLDCST